MNWDDVRIFLAVARAGQILGAARRLELNHATVSRRVAALEEALGAKLFRRLTTGSELTPAGERFLAVAERMEADMIAARAEIAGEATSDVSGTVRIGAPDGFGVAFLAPRLGALTAQHRDLKIQLVPVPRSFSLSRREADIAITIERPTEGRLVAAKLVDYSLGLYASRAYAEAQRPARRRGRTARRTVWSAMSRTSSSARRSTMRSEFSPRLGCRLSRSRRRSARSRRCAPAPASASCTPSSRGRCPTSCRCRRPTPIRRAYWLVYHESVRPLRRIQAVAGFIIQAVERERRLFQ